MSCTVVHSSISVALFDCRTNVAYVDSQIKTSGSKVGTLAGPKCLSGIVLKSPNKIYYTVLQIVIVLYKMK